MTGSMLRRRSAGSRLPSCPPTGLPARNTPPRRRITGCSNRRGVCTLQPRWGTISVADVDLSASRRGSPSMVRNGAGVTTVVRAHGVLSGILADAVKAKRLAANPAKGVENLPRKTARRHVYLSAEDVDRLADEAGEHRALVCRWPTAGCGGARQSR